MERRHEVLFEQLHTYRKVLLDVVEDVSEAEAEIVPDGFNNNIRWNLGHVLLDQYLWIRVLTKEDMPVPMSFNQWFGYGTNPSNFTDETPSFSELISLLQEQPRFIEQQYRDRLEEDFPPTDMGMHTLEQVLVRTIFHEGLHMGALLAIKNQIRNHQRV
ncbi:DinB family protein [Paenibacillus sp. FSL M8-0334]|uniref:DinB family protein n=1 Tax=Paenibacillus campinasensis TaxID=66347 RepID=A0ABW9SWP2_9BACL|nr:DinB family protein [Paenibacillus campinasensis]MUG65264.1 DinB family protein [Paenibacillus campinasensis]